MRVIWRGLHPDLTSLEYLTLEPWSRATGTVIETGDATGYAVRYEVDISPEGFPTRATFDLSDGRRFGLERTATGVWRQDQQEKPEFVLRRTAQRSTRLSPFVYRYENLSSGYSNEVTLDADGLVRSYPHAFDRVALE